MHACVVSSMEMAHVTSAALGEDAVKGRHVVKIIPKELDGKSKPEVPLGTLELGRTGEFGHTSHSIPA